MPPDIRDAILAMYNQVVLTSSAAREDRESWLAQRTALGDPVEEGQ